MPSQPNDNKFHTGSIKTLENARESLENVKQKITQINDQMKICENFTDFSKLFILNKEDREKTEEFSSILKEYNKETKEFYTSVLD
jgi:hypothetical protein